VVVVPRREMLDAPYARLESEFCMLLSRHSTHGSSPANSRSLMAGKKP
jgi:hypothetical protein